MNKFIKYATSVAGLATLVACSGGTCAPNDNPVGDLTLAIAAPSQYPAGLPVPIQAQLTMTNTSKVNASNLVYTVPAIGESGNYTGVTITPDAGIGSASGACTNIAAGASCTFIATIGAYAKPGSFIVTATPNGTASSNTKTTNSTKSLQAGSISVTANLGLVDVPNTQNQYYILPSDQTITANANGATTVMISVWVKQASEGLSSLRLVDEAGAALTYVTVGTPSYAINSVNTYRVTIPAGKTLQHIQALSNVCETLNNGDNNYTACSNDADVNLATQGHGILSVQPTQFNLSESYESQVITLTNIGTGNVGSISYPTFSSPFSVVTNNCSSITTLTPGQSCTMTVKYTAGSTAGQITPVFGYDDDNNAATEPKNTAIIIGYAAAITPDPGPGPGPAPVTPFSILSVTPTSASLTAENSRKVFTITNTPGGSTAGVTIASGWTLPTLSAPLQMESTNCYASSGSVGLGAPVPMVTKALAVGASCTYTIRYLSSASAGSASLAFTYNNGVSAGETASLAVDWAIFNPSPGPGPAPVTPFSILSVTPTSASLTAENSRKVFTITNTPGGSTAGVTIASGWTLPTLSAPLQMESTNCYASSGSVGLGAPVPMVTKALAVGASCTYTIRYLSSASAGSASLAFTYNNGVSAGETASLAVDWAIFNPSPVPVPATSCNGNCRIFVSSGTYTGDLKSEAITAGGTNINTGFEGADYLCQIDANNPVSGSTYWKALLLNNNSTVVGTDYYKLDNSTLIATASNGDLIWGSGGNLVNIIGIPLTGPDVWTGGYGSGYNCNDWTSPSATGSTGNSGAGNNPSWFQYNFPSCTPPGYIGNLGLYCVEQFHN